MKQIHRERLRKLAEYLLTQVPEEKFGMAHFRDGDHEPHICNTIGCALGWSPAIMSASTHRRYLHSARLREENSITWSQKIYVIISEEYFDICVTQHEVTWHYLFSSYWEHVDNTPQGAGARILYLLDHGMYEGFDHLEDWDRWDTSHYQKYLTTYNNEVN